MFVYGQEPVVEQTLWEKIVSLLQSVRFISAIVAAVVVLVGDAMAVDKELLTAIVTATMGVILGDSIRPMEELLKSRRFWAFIGSIVVILAAQFGINFPPGSVELMIITIASWIVGDSWRVTLTPRKERVLKSRAAARL